MRFVCWSLVLSAVVGPVTFVGNDARSQPAQAEIAAADWTKGLKSGPNGPIPAIVVDQFGYPERARKVAVVRDPQTGYDSPARFSPGSAYALIELPGGRIVKMGAPSPWKSGETDPASGDRAWWFDFSEITAPGRYAVVDLERRVRSPDFSIGDGVYRAVMKHALRAFFYQRAGAEKKPEFAGKAWADAPSHLGSGQDSQSRPWHGGRPGAAVDRALIRDLRGGWYDAGDYNKYTNWTARYIIALLQAYDEHPQAFGDDDAIPESGNAIPDILDEVKWGLDWLIRMQNPDGSVLCIQGLASASPPSAARGPSYYGPATTSATLMSAAAYAFASRVFAARSEPALKAFAADLRTRALAAWTWAQSNPNVLYYNNDNAKQPGSGGLAAGQQEMSEAERLRAKVEAATYLLELTGEDRFRSVVDANHTALLPEWGPTMWEVEPQEILLSYARLPQASPEVSRAIRERFVGRMRGSVESFEASLQQTDPYRAPMKDYTWGSNKGKAMQARLYQLLAMHGGDASLAGKAQAAALEYVHYIHGVNPLGLVYLTNMSVAGASHSASTMFHAWFASGTRWQRVTETLPGPPPGFLVGGANPQFSLDACCRAPSSSPAYRCYGAPAFALCQRDFSPPLGQPPAKAYLQFNDSWPANSWAVTEPSLSYQSYFVRLLAPFVR